MEFSQGEWIPWGSGRASSVAALMLAVVSGAVALNKHRELERRHNQRVELLLTQTLAAFAVIVGLFLAAMIGGMFGRGRGSWWGAGTTPLICPAAIRQAAKEVAKETPGIGVAAAWVASGSIYALFAFAVVRLMSHVKVIWVPRKSKNKAGVVPGSPEPLALRHDVERPTVDQAVPQRKIHINRTEYDPPPKKFNYTSN